MLVAVAIILANGLLIVFGPDARSVQTSYAFDSFMIGPLIVDATKAFAGLAAIAVAAALFAFFRFTRLGTAIRACADNYTGAQVIGLNVQRLYALTFGLGAACVGAAGAMLALVTDVTPPLGPSFTLLAFVIVIVGGLGSMPGALAGGILIGVIAALAGLFYTPSAKGMFVFAILVLSCCSGPKAYSVDAHDPTSGREPFASCCNSARGGPDCSSRRALVCQRLPAHGPDPHFLFRIHRAGLEHHDGFCGPVVARPRDLYRARRLCDGGAVRFFGISPWLGSFAAILLAVLCGAMIGFLAFRFRVAGVYFAILTIAFAEFARIGFDHLSYVGGSAGFFLPVANYTQSDLWTLRGKPIMFYYLSLGMTVAAVVLCHIMVRSRLGYFWQAIREDEEAARAVGINTFRYKLIAVVISAAMTSLAGVFFAFYYNNLFPEEVFSINRSIELILAPIFGGLGTLFGPILGAFMLTGLAETLTTTLAALGVDVPGAKQVFYGVCLLLVITVLPDGVWPWLCRRLGLAGRSE